MTDRADKGGGKATDLSFMARLITGVRYIVTGKDRPEGDATAAPFSPGQPIQPVFQEDMRGRQFDYQTGINLTYVPRQEEPISFSQMRGLADSYDLLRLAIETCKDQACKVPFHVVPRDKKAKPDAACKNIEDFMQYPDREHDFYTWLRMIMEDLLVIDAPTLYPRMTKGGGLYALEPMDGTLIKRVIDATGRTPQPPDPAYQQYIKGVPAVNYSADELIYKPRNRRTWKVYGFSPVEQVIMTVNIAIRRQLHQLSYYTEGNIPDLIFQVPETWNADQIAQFQTWWDSLNAGNLAGRRQGRFVPHGVEPYDIKQAAMKDEYDEWLGRIICYAFSLSPTSFIKQMNRASGEIQKEESDEQGLVPRLMWVKSLLDYTIAKYFKRPDLHSIYEKEKDIDPKVQAEIDEIYLGNYVISAEEVRERIGLEGPAPEKPEPSAIGDDLSKGGKDAGKPGAGNSGNGRGDDNKGAVGASKKVEKVERAEQGKKKLSRIDRERKTVKEARVKIQKIVGSFFEKEAERIADQIQAGIEAVDRADADVPMVDVAKIIADLDMQGFSMLIDPVTKELQMIFADGATEGLKQIGFASTDSMTDLLNERSLAYAEARAADLVGMKNIGTKEVPEWVPNPNAKYVITDSTREMLRSTVSTSIEEGWSPQKLKAKIRESHAFSASRAETIARTETAFADVAGNMAAYRESGVVMGKEWILGSQHDDDDKCDLNAQAGPIGLDAIFPSGDTAPPQHPNCLAAGTVVTASGVSKHYTRWFEGEVIVLSISGMNDITITPNHPVLTERGWIAAGEIQKGDYLVYCGSPRELLSIVHPQDEQVIGAIEDVARTLLMASGVVSKSMPTAPEDFHGDGVVDGKVEVIDSTRFLRSDNPTLSGNEIVKTLLRFGHRGWARLDANGMTTASLKAPGSPPDRIVSRYGSGGFDTGGKPGVEYDMGLSGVSDLQASAGKDFSEGGTMATVTPSNVHAGLPRQVSGMDVSNLGFGESALPGIVIEEGIPRPEELPLDNFMCDTLPVGNALDRLSGLITFVQISNIRKVFFSGHVYNLQTRDNWYFAENIITHNCVCDVLPVVMGKEGEE